MGRIRDLVGIIKDKASQSKAAIISKPKTFSLQLAILRATTHDHFAPPNPKYITTLLSYGHSSRATAAAAVEALMDRLQSTHDSSVAIKCLILVHHIIKHGTFILQDQLSVYPYTGGRNYLNFSSFRDNTTPITWELSSWVRWYSRYLEHLLSTSRVLGFFLCSTSNTAEKDREEERISTLTNLHLLKEVESLANLMEEICKRPDSLFLHGNELIEQVINWVSDDYLSSINEIAMRVDEFSQRLSCLSFGDSVELVWVLKRLEICKDRLLDLSNRKKALVESVWCLISEMKEKVGNREERELLLSLGGKESGSESARFGERVLRHGDSVMFSSERFGLNNGYGLTILDQ